MKNQNVTKNRRSQTTKRKHIFHHKTLINFTKIVFCSFCLFLTKCVIHSLPAQHYNYIYSFVTNLT